jgi:spore maturation protein CgeB
VKIVLYGEAHQAGSGAYCYAETLRELGHQVILVSNAAGLEWYATFSGRVTRKLAGVLQRHLERHAEALVQTVQRERPELVIVLKGVYVGAAEVLGMRATGAFVCIINHDDFFSANPSNHSALQREALPHYDFVFATREVNVAEVAPINPNVEFFPFAYHPRLHRPVPIPPQFETDVVFVGTWEAERCALLEQLVQQVPARYAIWGSLWSRAGRRSPLRPYLTGRDALEDDQCRALGGAKIALAFLRKQNRDDYTQRTFEIPACGGLLLAERTARHSAFYREGVEAELFDPDDPAELIQKVRALLADPERRDAIRSAGQAAVARQHHTYRDRLLRLLEVQQQRSKRAARTVA